MRVNDGQVETLVRSCLEEMGFPASEVAPDQILEDDPGLDSIEVVELVAMVLKGAGLPTGTVVPPEGLTIGRLAEHVRQASTEPVAKAG